MLSELEREKYCQKAEAMRQRGVRVGDVLTCDEGARPKPCAHTGKLCVRIMEYCIIDGTGPRFFIHGYQKGLVAYVPDFVQDSDNTQVIPPGTKFRVMKESPHSVVLRQE